MLCSVFLVLTSAGRYLCPLGTAVPQVIMWVTRCFWQKLQAHIHSRGRNSGSEKTLWQAMTRAPRECCSRPKHPKSQCISSVCCLFLSLSSDVSFRIQRNSGTRKGGEDSTLQGLA